MKVVGFDHVVLNVADVERSLRFYCDELGMECVLNRSMQQPRRTPLMVTDLQVFVEVVR